MREDLLIIDEFLPREQALHMASIPITPAPGRHDTEATAVYGRDVIAPIVLDVQSALAQHFGLTEPIYCDYAAASQSTQGMSHQRHADAVTLTGEPNHTPWRVVTAMLYLNDYGADFTGGGELHFPNIDQTVIPRAGRLVGFRCDAIHTHEVPQIQTGSRRALAFWFTHDPSWDQMFV
jgi:predicted 2-oxoglutarate/Fe(II)-dependent dioxygenase YbiX